MALIYESPEFSEELVKRINSNNEYREKAKGMMWKLLLIVEDLPLGTYSSYVNGELVERIHVPQKKFEELKKEADFTVGVPTYELSVEMATGRKSLESLFLGGILKLEGSIFKALQYRDAIERTGKITAELTKESIIPSKGEFVTLLRERHLI